MSSLAVLICVFAVIILGGCTYAAWNLLTDLIAGWRESSRRAKLPRRFGIGMLFGLTTVVAITSMLIQGVRVHGVAEGAALVVISLAWAAAILFGLQSMLTEYLRGTSFWRRTTAPPIVEEATDAELNAVTSESEAAHSESPSELDTWLSQMASEEPSQDASRARQTSTKAMRSHFRVQLPDDPKGVKAAGFGRF